MSKRLNSKREDDLSKIDVKFEVKRAKRKKIKLFGNFEQLLLTGKGEFGPQIATKYQNTVTQGMEEEVLLIVKERQERLMEESVIGMQNNIWLLFNSNLVVYPVSVVFTGLQRFLASCTVG